MSGRGDPRPERQRYTHASWTERLAGELRSMRAHPGVVLALLLVLGGGLALNILRPQVLSAGQLAPRDCLYIRADDATDVPPGRAIGSDAAAVRTLFSAGAERAGCDASHSHEVLLTIAFEEAAGADFPGEPDLRDRLRGSCEAAFEARVGPLEESELGLIVAVPNEAAWGGGARSGVCLVARRDGTFLSAQALASGG